MRSTADGGFPTTKWKAGDHIRDRYTLSLPPDWKGDLVVGLVAADATSGQKERPTGPVSSTDADIAILGVLPLTTGSTGAPHP
jgi:hypothetical protein